MPFEIIHPKTQQVPILVSVPHCGTDIPADLRDQYRPEMIARIDDTDWYVDQLYDFVGELGIKMIKARYTRWVIDLNRTADSTPLYNDGRVITALCPTTDFNGKNIYTGEGPTPADIEQRINAYYMPYYDQIRMELAQLQQQFKHVLFFDAHSIRQLVPGIRAEKFPDLILGDADGKAADAALIKNVENVLSSAHHSFSHNHPFKGGNLTRTFGQPQNGIHALQLEMAKTVYMDDTEMHYDTNRVADIRVLLRKMFENLIDTLFKLNQA